MAKIGFGDFILGRKWKPGNHLFGIFPMIMGSICVTGVSLVIGVPIAIFTSVFMEAYCPKKIYRVCQAAINLMAGVPSIVYGFFGLVLMIEGNQPRMPVGLFKGLRTMTANIVLEMGYAADLHREALIATSVVLFVFILVINLAVSALNRRSFHE